MNRYERLQKLNKEATPGEWEAKDARLAGHNWIAAGHSWVAPYPLRERDATLIVECRNSLPAVLNLIEAVRDVVEMDEHAGKRRHPTKLEVALAPFMDESW